ncbi:MAG TPA: hypothetical protein PLE99_14510 [Candidatus Thiothrix moscowensis]|uniref:hypothetical protein n=1 Tax=unclassified Thiothrix TaxID=2636184 RepID=UPI0025DA5140|nr:MULTISPECIES: hypothetical protein [unclassified Thiothrix]HRJ53967.1 hypothetical protein [Candidatus Thiothrix moscowensis]HRJ94049.1 hypothetical protein [Candidatus Thiothrix moscowensis]
MFNDVVKELPENSFAETDNSLPGVRSIGQESVANGYGFSVAVPLNEDLRREIWKNLKDESEENILREHDQNYIVYWDRKDNLRWRLGDKCEQDLDMETSKILVDVENVSALPVDYLSNRQRAAWASMLGHAVSLVSSNKAESARRIVEITRQFIVSRAKEKARIWMVQASITTSAVSLFACLLLWVISINSHIMLALASMGFGIIGAQFSILVRLHQMKVDPSAGRIVHWSESVIRVMTGMFAAIILYVALRSGIVFPFIDTVFENNHIPPTKYLWMFDDKNFWVLAFMSTLAGFSERFVPSFLDKIEDKNMQHVGDKSLD